MRSESNKVAGLILAAGASTRMGELKQLLKMGEQTLLDKVLTQAFESDLHHVVLVLQHQAQIIKEVVRVR